MNEFKFTAADRKNLKQWCPEACIDALAVVCGGIVQDELRAKNDRKKGYTLLVAGSKTKMRRITKKINQLLDDWSTADILTRQKIEEALIDISPAPTGANQSLFSSLYQLQEALNDMLSRMPPKTPRKSSAGHVKLIAHVVQQYGVKSLQFNSEAFINIVDTCFRAMNLKNDENKPASVEHSIRTYVESKDSTEETNYKFLEDTPPQSADISS